MGAKEVAEQAGEAVVSILERATEMRFCLHLVCVFLYLEISLFLILKRSQFTYGWSALDSLTPGQLAVLLLGYFFVMGYLLRLLFGIVSHFLSKIYRRFYWNRRESLRNSSGWVHRQELLSRAYQSKDSELLRQTEERKKTWHKTYKENSEMAYLAFSVLVLCIANAVLVSNGLFDQCVLLATRNFVIGGLILLSLPLITLIWMDASVDVLDQYYVYHLDIYQEIQAKKKSPDWKR